MTMQTVGLTPGAKVEIISAYAASNQQLPAIGAAPAWVVIGALYMPIPVTVILEAIGLISLNGVVLSVRLFDVVGSAPVSGSETAQINGTVDERVVSGAFDLPGGKVYQMQAQCIGSSGFGIVRAAQLLSS